MLLKEIIQIAYVLTGMDKELFKTPLIVRITIPKML